MVTQFNSFFIMAYINIIIIIQNISRFWLVKTTRIIHHNQLLLTKTFCHIQPMTSKVQPAADYWTIDVKDYWTIDRENLGTRLCYLSKREMAASRFTSVREEYILNE